MSLAVAAQHTERISVLDRGQQFRSGIDQAHCSTPCSRSNATSVIIPKKELTLWSSTHIFMPRLCGPSLTPRHE